MAKLQSRQKAALTASYAESGLLQPRLNLVVQRLGLLALRNRPEHLQRLLRQYFEAIGQIQFGTGEELRFVRQALRGRQQEDVARRQEVPGYEFPLRGRGIVAAAHSGGNAQQDAALQHGCLQSEERRVGKECRSRWSPY